MGYKLIIVDGNEIIKESLVNFEWDTVGVEIVASFNNCSSALMFLKQHDVQIALVDMCMPIIDKVEFIKYIHNNFRNISIICLSGYSDYEYLRICMQLGVKDYLLKPIDSNELFSTVLSLVNQEGKEQSKNVVKSHNYIISNAMDYVDNNYQHKIKLADVAENICLNPVYFSRVFKQHMGVGFVEYLTDFRIEKAILLMQDPSIRINIIAAKVGFYSSRYFADIFKKRKGMTPSEYRNRYWNSYR